MLVVAAVVLPSLVFVAAASISYQNHLAEARQKLSRALDVANEHAEKVFETLELVAGQVDQVIFGRTDDEIKSDEQALHLRFKKATDKLDQVDAIWVVNKGGTLILSSSSSRFQSKLT